jgi:hypothetical protein
MAKCYGFRRVSATRSWCLPMVAGFAYKVTDYYSSAGERTIAWNDPDLAIPWPIAAEKCNRLRQGSRRRGLLRMRNSSPERLDRTTLKEMESLPTQVKVIIERNDSA